jgi:hypothetical protein
MLGILTPKQEAHAKLISIINDVGLAYTAYLFSYKIMLKLNGQQNPKMSIFRVVNSNAISSKKRFSKVNNLFSGD